MESELEVVLGNGRISGAAIRQKSQPVESGAEVSLDPEILGEIVCHAGTNNIFGLQQVILTCGSLVHLKPLPAEECADIPS